MSLLARSRALRLTGWAVAIVVALVLVPYFLAPFYRFGHPVSALMLERRLTGARVERIWIPFDAVPPAVAEAVIAAEDAHFCTHHGIDFGEVRQALADAEEGGRLRGGSTITQQVAKNLFLWQGRSFVRKALEAPLALWIDLVLPKRRILEIYLNIAAWGPGAEFGIEAGARRAFGKSARALTAQEGALMAAILPNPIRRSASRPRPAVQRLAGIYLARAHARMAAGFDRCLRR
ncbi:MAG TPA: monofunctional biosynthetic peptidoglycan transglycosylase [Xanthobacteraceae bacterium]|nr:monofunctional biosynthetic peptidoglycan transglycosylase [Xanthobacteraceae bacterium]